MEGPSNLVSLAERRRIAEAADAPLRPDVLLAVPWHSTDASNWEANPGRFGKWKAFGGVDLGLRGGQQDLRAEVAWYLDLERLAPFKWRGEMEVLQVEPLKRSTVATTGKPQT